MNSDEMSIFNLMFIEEDYPDRLPFAGVVKFLKLGMRQSLSYINSGRCLKISQLKMTFVVISYDGVLLLGYYVPIYCFWKVIASCSWPHAENRVFIRIHPYTIYLVR